MHKEKAAVEDSITLNRRRLMEVQFPSDPTLVPCDC